MTTARATILPAAPPLPLAIRRRAIAALAPYDVRDAMAVGLVVVSCAAFAVFLLWLTWIGG